MDDQTRILHVTIGTADTRSRRKTISNGTTANGAASTTNGVVHPKLPLDTLSRLLSERNITLLKMIKTAQPESVAELARLSGRPKASLTLTLRRLEQFGIVAFKRTTGRRKIPTVLCDRLMLEVAIDT